MQLDKNILCSIQSKKKYVFCSSRRLRVQSSQQDWAVQCWSTLLHSPFPSTITLETNFGPFGRFPIRLYFRCSSPDLSDWLSICPHSIPLPALQERQVENFFYEDSGCENSYEWRSSPSHPSPLSSIHSHHWQTGETWFICFYLYCGSFWSHCLTADKSWMPMNGVPTEQLHERNVNNCS